MWGGRCTRATIKDVALELRLDWHAIGIDEISIRKGHTCRIVVSELIRRRPIWFGGEDRSEASMAQFYDCLGDKKSRGIRAFVWR